MLCYPRSPPLPVWLYITWKLFSEGSTRASVEFYKWKQRQENDPIDSKLYHNHGDSLAEISQRAKDKRNKKKEEKYKIEKSAEEMHLDEQVDQPFENRLTKKEELVKSLGKQTEKLKIWEAKFDDWSSTKAKEMAKLVSEETNAEVQKNELCRQRERVRESIARLELENKELAKKIIETDHRKNKLVKKRHKYEDRTDEKLYEYKIEKAKLQDGIQKIKFEMSRIVDVDEKDSVFNKASNYEIANLKMDRTNRLAKEIEENERDLECSVCFELCVAPIYMCHLSHTICKQCRPKMKYCPQCREPYKKHKMRHKAKEATSDQLQILYKTMQEHLEAD